MNSRQPSNNGAEKKKDTMGENTDETQETGDEDSDQKDDVDDVTINSGEYESNATDSKKNGIPTIAVNLRATVEVLSVTNSFPPKKCYEYSSQSQRRTYQFLPCGQPSQRNKA
jgi:hypothetical protein